MRTRFCLTSMNAEEKADRAGARRAVEVARPYSIGFYYHQPYGISAKAKCLLCGTLRTAFPTGHGSIIWDCAYGGCLAGACPRDTGKCT